MPPAPNSAESASPQASAFARYSILAVLALTLLAYAGAARYEFVFDDKPLILENPYLRSWDHIPHFFSGHLFSHMDALGNYYRPVLQLWLLLNYSLWGPQPGPWHLSTLAMHLLATLLVYRLALRLTRDAFTACAAALIFGLHPVHVEAVAWVLGVTEPFAATLALGSVLCYFCGREETAQRWPWRIASLALFVLAILSKETALVLPALIFAHEYLFAAEQPPQAVPARLGAALRYAAPYLGLAAVYFPVRIAVLGAMTHPVTPLPLATLFFTAPSVLWFYLRVLAWPFGLSAFYDTPNVTSPDVSHFLLPLVAVLAVVGFLLWVAHRSRVAAWAALWLALPMLLLLNLTVFPEGEIAHDRYLYMPSIGFCLLVALALRQLRFGRAKILGQPVAPAITIMLLAVILGVTSAQQKEQWRSNRELFSRGARVAPNNNLVANNLAGILFDAGQQPEAISLLQQVLERNPGHWQTHYNLGYCYYRANQLAEAESQFLRGIALNPRASDLHYRLGLTWLRMGRTEKALEAMRNAVSLNPVMPGYHVGIGLVLESQGKLAEALAEFRAELANDPRQPVAHEHIAAIEARLRSGDAGGASPAAAPQKEARP